MGLGSGRDGPTAPTWPFEQKVDAGLERSGDSAKSQTPDLEPDAHPQLLQEGCSAHYPEPATLGSTMTGSGALFWVPNSFTAGRQRRFTPEQLSPPFRVQVGRLRPREGQSPGRFPLPEGEGGGAGGEGTTQLQLLRGCA